MKSQAIFNITIVLTVFLLYCLMLKKNNIEKFTAQELTLDSFRKIMTDTYKVDIDAIRNLSNVAGKLQEGGLTIPGDLRVTGKLTVEKDASLKKNLTVDYDTAVMRNLYVKDYTSSKRLDVRNSESVAGRGWTHFNHDNTGNNYIRGNLIQDQGDNTVNGNITSSGNVHATGNMTTNSNLTVAEKGTFKRVDILPGDGRWNTHFNYHDNGENYISGGKLHVRGANHDQGHIVNGITETGAIRPRHFPAPNGMPLWPGDQQFGNLWSHVKARDTQLGDIIPITANDGNNHHRIGGFVTYDKRNWDGLVHGRLMLVDRHNKWARDPNNHHMYG